MTIEKGVCGFRRIYCKQVDIMGFLESIGALALLAIAGYFALMHLESQSEVHSISNNFVKYRELVGEEPSKDQHERHKQVRKALRDPQKRAAALDRAKRKQRREEEYKQELRSRRKFGYKYDTAIFNLFDTDRELSTQELLLRIESKFNIDSKSATRLLEAWKTNGLVKKCSWNPGSWEVGHTLTMESFKIDDNDLTLGEWLEQNGKTLKPESKEYRDYMSRIDDDLPF